MRVCVHTYVCPLMPTRVIVYLHIPLRCLINSPPAYKFFGFFQPPDLIRTPCLLIFEEAGHFYELLILFPFFISAIHAHFSRKHSEHASLSILVVCFVTTCFCSFCRFITNHFKPFLSFILTPPCLLTFRFNKRLRPPVH